MKIIRRVVPCSLQKSRWLYVNFYYSKIYIGQVQIFNEPGVKVGMLFDCSRILEKQANLVVIHKLLLSQEYIYT